MTYLFAGKLGLRISGGKEYVAVVFPEELAENYGHVFSRALTHAFKKGDSLEAPLGQARIYIGRVFNEDGEVVVEVNSVVTVDVKYLSRYLLPNPPGETSGGMPGSQHATPGNK